VFTLKNDGKVEPWNGKLRSVSVHSPYMKSKSLF